MCVLLSVVIFCPNSEQFFYFGICCLPYCCVIVIFYCAAIRATVRELLGRETVVPLSVYTGKDSIISK